MVCVPLKMQKQTPQWVSAFGGHRKELAADLPQANRKDASPSSNDAQQSTGLLDFIVRVPPIMQKSRHPNGYLLFWYTGRDSNPQPSEPESDALSIEPPVRFLQLGYYSSLFLLCKEESGKYFLSDFFVSTGKRLFSRNSCGIIQNIVNFSLI